MCCTRSDACGNIQISNVVAEIDGRTIVMAGGDAVESGAAAASGHCEHEPPAKADCSRDAARRAGVSPSLRRPYGRNIPAQTGDDGERNPAQQKQDCGQRHSFRRRFGECVRH
jgi:hypothetical protein